jgi:uncharacterized protein YndB with AHSA1/START domain
MPEKNLEFELLVDAPRAQTYRAFTNPTALREWFSDLALADARPGGRLYFWWNDGYYASGAFTDLVQEEKITYTWHGRDEPGPSRVEVSMTAERDGTRVRVTHLGFGSGEDWAKTREMFQKGWEYSLENLKSVLETGQDLRYVLRPMLGILVGEFNEDIAQDLGVPVSEGIRLDGVVEGMGSQAAGLQAGDVLVTMAGSAVSDWPSLTSALSAHRAGDQVEVVFYRGAEKKTTTMELSQRPLPEVPATPDALADAVRVYYDEVLAELDVLCDGLSDAEASFHPGPDEWSAKETLAHLLVSEREFQSWLANLITDDEPWNDRFENPTAVQARLKAAVGVYPTVGGLLEALKKTKAETVALLRGLPPEFLARRGSWVRLGYNLLEMPGYHERIHLDQMRTAVEKA